MRSTQLSALFNTYSNSLSKQKIQTVVMIPVNTGVKQSDSFKYFDLFDGESLHPLQLFNVRKKNFTEE